MTYLFDSMFLQSRIQLSSLLKLIPKPPCSGGEKPACSGERQEACGSVGLICLSAWGCCSPEFRVRFRVIPLWEAAPASLTEQAGLGAEGILEQTQGLGDLSCMGKSNHAAAALGCYFSTWGWLWEDFFLLWAELELSQWTFHPATRNKPSDCCTGRLVWKCLFGTKGFRVFHIHIFHIHVFVMSDGPAESQSSKNCAGKTSSVNFRNSTFILR